MPTKQRARARLALPNNRGEFKEREIVDGQVIADELTHCPETGRSLADVSPAKWAANLWPTLDPDNLPRTEAGRRYGLLLVEQDRRDQLAHD